MLERQFPDDVARIAVGLAGEGSECLGFDDDISTDHDFDCGFMMWLTEEDMARIGMQLQKAYEALPLEEFAYRHTGVQKQNSLYGGNRHGVKTIGGFFAELVGSPYGPEDWQDWLLVPSYALCNVTNGEVFTDPLGELTKRRTALMYLPEDIRKKKVAACAAYMAQSGQYNYSRCLAHGEEGAAMLALTEFVKYTVTMIYLLNRRHCPYYKWMLRGMRELPVLGELEGELSSLLTRQQPTKERQQSIERVCGRVIDELVKQSLSIPAESLGTNYMEAHGLAVMRTIEDERIRSLHLMQG